MYSTTWCGDCARAKKFFDEHNLVYEEMDIEANPDAAVMVESINNGNRSVPTIIVKFEGGTEETLVEPTWTELESVFLPSTT
jgi:mycoredoxin